VDFERAGALVTGGASGLGAAAVRALHAAGATVTIVDRDVALGKGLAAALGGRARFVEADVTDAGQVQAAVDRASDGVALRIAVSCAGIAPSGLTVDDAGVPHDPDLFARVIGVNLIGTFHVVRLAAARMVSSDPARGGERGVIVNTASIAALDPQAGQVAYAASKGGVIAMTLTAAHDLAAKAIRVVAVAPGLFATPMLPLDDAGREALGASVPFPSRLGEPGEFGALVRHIAENQYLNGEVIRLDGSLRLPLA
jgi:NAD(P)-dependent dehydrogenase (short-subunit alcohol dehydrogenase family)